MFTTMVLFLLGAVLLGAWVVYATYRAESAGTHRRDGHVSVPSGRHGVAWHDAHVSVAEVCERLRAERLA